MLYNCSLSKADRKLYTERLIKLHTILGRDTTTEYKHEIWTQQTDYSWFKRWRTGHSCGTAACAMGHALLHADQFPGLQVNDQRELHDLVRMLDKQTGEQRAAGIQPLTPGSGAMSYFGPRSFEYIFNAYAYDVPAEKVTRAMAMRRIEEYITTVLGCQLLEEETA